MTTSRSIIIAICDHFASSLTPFGRPDPKRTRLATGGAWSELVTTTTLHSPPFMAMALYRAGMALERTDYIAAADRLTLYLLAAIREPTNGRWDCYSDRVRDFIREQTGNDASSQIEYFLSRSWMSGIALDTVCRGFMRAHPDETSLLSKAAALYDGLRYFRTERGPHFRIGYTPSGLPQGENIDGAFTDDLGLVGRGLASYFTLSQRRDVLADLQMLARFFLHAHREGSDDGAFSESIGTWVICPWPMEIAGEHFGKKRRADQIGWGFSTREAIDFLSRLYPSVDDSSIKRDIRTRCVSAMKWVFDETQHSAGGVGIIGRDDAFTGMAAAGVMNFLDCRDAGFLSEAEAATYGAKARRAMDWICAFPPDTIIERAGHEHIGGGVSLDPPENLAWMLAWTVEALLREGEL